MSDSDLDRILSNEEEILPSSGFAASVMEAVQREAAAPPPIPFPWKRALPGLCAATLALIAVIATSIQLLSRALAHPSTAAKWHTAILATLEASRTSAATWTILALFLSFASVKLAMHLASGSTPHFTRT